MLLEISKADLSKSDSLFLAYQSAMAFNGQAELDKINEQILELSEKHRRLLISGDSVEATATKNKADLLRSRRTNVAIDISFRREIARNALQKHNQRGLDILKERLTRAYNGIWSQINFQFISDSYLSNFSKVYQIESNIIAILKAQIPVAACFEAFLDTPLQLSQAIKNVDSVVAISNKFDDEPFRLIESEFHDLKNFIEIRPKAVQAALAIKSVLSSVESLKNPNRPLFKAA